MAKWVNSRKFVGTVILTVLYILDGNGILHVPSEVVPLWMTWLVAEGGYDVARAVKGRSEKEMQSGA